MYSTTDVQDYVKNYRTYIINNIKNNQQQKRVFTKTLNHPQLIDFKLFEKSTSPKNPICIIDVDRFDCKYVIIDKFIFDKAMLCSIEILKIKDIELSYGIKLDFHEYKYIPEIINWVNKVYIAPWGKNRKITKITYTYPKLKSNINQCHLALRETKEEYIKRKNKEIKDSGGKKLNSEYIKY